MLMMTLVLAAALAGPAQLLTLGEMESPQESVVPSPPPPPAPPAPPAPVAAIPAVPATAPAPPAPAVAVAAVPRVAAVAQTPRTPKAPAAPATPAAPAVPAVPPAPPTPAAPREPAQLINVQVDVTVSDQVGSAAALVRTISATAGDGERASVRSGSEVKTEFGFKPVGLALDIRPRVVGPSKVRVEVSLDTSSVDSESAAKQVRSFPTSKTTQSVVLESGRSVVLSQTLDPLTDRKTTIEVKATIVR